jgi:hypothetical protein
MKRFIVTLFILATTIPAVASPTAQPVALLERAIAAFAATGELISLRDAQCQYSGQLVREPANDKSFGAAVAKAAGADTGRWHIDISRRTCGQQTEQVRMRADLPTPPSLAGGGGYPSMQSGYEAGRKFTLSHEK